RGLVLTGAVAPEAPPAPATASVPGSEEEHAGQAVPSAVPATGAEWPLRRIRWAPACRIVPTRHPTVYLFDRVAQPADFEALYALEALTNDRVRDEIGCIGLVAPEDRVFGPGTGPIMAAFTHLNPAGSR